MTANDGTLDREAENYDQGDTPISNTDNCYCVCHSPVASSAYCEHCKGNNEVGRYHGFAHPSNTEQLKENIEFLLDRTANFPNQKLRDGSIEKIIELVATHTAEAVRAARIDELSLLDKETKNHVYVERDGYLKDRLAQLKKGNV